MADILEDTPKVGTPTTTAPEMYVLGQKYQC